MPSRLDDLVARYKQVPIAFPSLKAVTLAQWMLESGRGESGLAKEHRNFAGLKWRKEMVGFATPVEYVANDGLDFYCSFASLDAFIVGYWKFLSRAPYKGWEKKAEKSAEAFLAFIGPIYNPAGAKYVQQVTALTAEATRRLKSAPAGTADLAPPVAGTQAVIVIDPGHGGTVKIGGSSPNNAKSPSGELEKNWTLDFARRTRAAVLAKAAAAGRSVDVVLTRDTDANKALAARANVAKFHGARLFLSIHMNAADKPVRGIETLIHPHDTVNKEKDRAFAQAIQNAALAALREIDPTTKSIKNYDRKVKEQSLGVLHDIELGNTVAAHPCRACLVELEFMHGPAVDKLFRLASPATAVNRQRVADGLADALLAQLSP